MRACSIVLLASGANAAWDITDMVLGRADSNPIQARQDTTETEEVDYPGPTLTVTNVDCLSAVYEVATAAPTPPAKLASYMGDDYCVTSLPDDLKSASSSWYQDAWPSFTSANGDLVTSALGECPDATKQINDLIQMCAETDAAEADDDKEVDDSEQKDDDEKKDGDEKKEDDEKKGNDEQKDTDANKDEEEEDNNDEGAASQMTGGLLVAALASVGAIVALI